MKKRTMDAKQAMREYQKQYYQTHSEHLRQYQKDYTKTHRDEIRKKHRINYRLRKMELLNATSERSKKPLRKPLRRHKLTEDEIARRMEADRIYREEMQAKLEKYPGLK
jgi:hypothetical protein